MLVPFLTAAISMGVVYLYGAVGETLIEKGGSLNLGIPGIMCLGALGGVIGANVYGAIFGSNIIGVVLILFSNLSYSISLKCSEPVTNPQPPKKKSLTTLTDAKPRAVELCSDCRGAKEEKPANAGLTTLKTLRTLKTL